MRFYDEPLRCFLSRRMARRLVTPPPTDGLAIAALVQAEGPGGRGDSASGGDSFVWRGNAMSVAGPGQRP
jgi:hypothetical protein